MKRFLAILFGLLLLLSAGCTCYRLELNLPGRSTPEPTAVPAIADATPQAQQQTPAPTAAPSAESIMDIPVTVPPTEPPYAPDLSLLPIVYNVYEEVGWNVNEATMFEYDVDFDGKDERISFRYDDDAHTTTIRFGDKSILLDGSNLTRVILIDLDPETPYVNLLVSIDLMSADYCTTELHYTDGKIQKGTEIYDLCDWDDDRQALIFYETCEMLGTKIGVRSYSGENLKPDTDWLVMSNPITEDNLKSYRAELIEMGDLLHCKRDVPCKINGKEAKIAKGSYLYMVGFNDAHDTAEVCTEDGVTAYLHFTFEDWEYSIAGKTVDRYFDNLAYAG